MSVTIAMDRWHWTLDEDNPKRVSIRQYAKEVGRTHSIIARMVNGYVAWTSGPASGSTLGEYIERATMSTERAAATEAVAKVQRSVSGPETRPGLLGGGSRRLWCSY